LNKLNRGPGSAQQHCALQRARDTGGRTAEMPGARPEHSTSGGLLAPAAERNKDPILAVLKRVLPERGTVLEIASGTGQHVVHFAKAFPSLQWQPSDPDRHMHGSIARWIEHEGLANVQPPIALDVGLEPWPVDHAEAVICINMIHIAPWQATLDLMAGGGRALPPGGVLVLYGPYRRFGQHTADSNAAFDAQLKATDPQWGVRDLEAVLAVARQHGLAAEEIVAMPANNFTVVLRKSSEGDLD
jgi:SAM-dependent methyltransferase